MDIWIEYLGGSAKDITKVHAKEVNDMMNQVQKGEWEWMATRFNENGNRFRGWKRIRTRPSQRKQV